MAAPGIARVKDYQRKKLLLFALSALIDVVFLVLLQFSDASRALKDFSQAISLQWPPAGVYLLIFFNLFYFITLPLSFYSGFVLERRFGLSTEKPSRWVADASKKYVLSLGFFLLTAGFFLWSAESFPRTWWLLAGIGWLILSVLLARIFPKVILPLFYKTTPLSSGELKDRLLSLCSRAGFAATDVYEVAFSSKTKKANAALAGIGRSRRVLLTDTLTDRYAPEEIEMVLAHELGHHAKAHIRKTLFFGAAVALAGFYLLHAVSRALVDFLKGESLSDLSVFPAVVLSSTIASFFLMPFQNAFSRRHEREADDYALSLLPFKGVFISLMRKLAAQNLSDMEPDPWVEFLFYDHPSIQKRIRRAESR